MNPEPFWWRKVAAEFLGTFAFIFIGTSSVIVSRLSGTSGGILEIALAHGIALAVVISALGNISGGYFNPAISIIAALTRQITRKIAVAYILVQIVAGILATLIAVSVFPESAVTASSAGGTFLASTTSVYTGFFLELIFSTFLAFAIFATLINYRASPGLGGFPAGLVLFLAILIIGPLTGASLNPARSIGSALLTMNFDHHWIYWAGPILGAIIGGLLFRRVIAPKHWIDNKV